MAPIVTGERHPEAPRASAQNATSIYVGGTPSGSLYDPGNGLVYVLNFGSSSAPNNYLDVINGTAIEAVVTVGSGPNGATYDSRNGYVYVSNTYSDTVSVINGTSVVSTLTLGGSYPESALYDSGNGYVYVTRINFPWPGAVSVINGTKVIANVTVSYDPYAEMYDPENGYVYVTNSGTNVISIISGLQVVASINLGGTSGGNAGIGAVLDTANHLIYVAGTHGNVSVVNDTKLVGRIGGLGGATGVTFDSGNDLVYVTNAGANTVSVISNMTLAATVVVGSWPSSPRYDTGNGLVYVANANSLNVSVINGSKVVASITVGTLPGGMSYDAGNGYLYVVNGGSGNVTAIQTLPTYEVTFDETGLPSGTEWEVAVAGGPSTSSNLTTLAVQEINGNFSYTAVSSNVSYHCPNGTFMVNGSALIERIAFYEQNFSVGFIEGGLPGGTVWSVTLGGATRSARSATMVFVESNGTYLFTVGAVTGFAPSPATGTVTVNGANRTFGVEYSPTYNVTFDEVGLAFGMTWSVDFSGVEKATSQLTLTFPEPNGAFAFVMGTLVGYEATPSSGTLVVNGAPRSILVTFTTTTPVTYDVTFSEMGLPSGMSWSVGLGGTLETSISPSFYFTETNGTYPYVVGYLSGYSRSPSSGTVNVTGADQNLTVTFTQQAYSVTFTETGLPAGTSWKVALNGTEHASTSASLTFAEPNGNFSYSIDLVPGYTMIPSSGSINIKGASVVESVTFSPSPGGGGSGPPSPLFGIPKAEGIVALEAILVALAVGAATLVLWIRKRRTPAAPPELLS
jgi:YVTN family beta-propeller protein